MEYMPANKMSIAWQLPQYALVTAGEVMFSVTGLEFSYSQVGFCKWKVEVELLLRGWSFNPDIASLGASLVAQMVKNLPIMQLAQVQSLGWEDPLEKRKLPTPVFRPGEFHGLYSPWGRKQSDMTE